MKNFLSIQRSRILPIIPIRTGNGGPAGFHLHLPIPQYLRAGGSFGKVSAVGLALSFISNSRLKSGFRFLIFVCSAQFSLAQNPLEKQWDMRYGGTGNDFLNYDHKEIPFSQTNDGGYILVGHSYSGIGGDKTQPSQGEGDYWIVKTDSLGNLQWEKTFGGVQEDNPAYIQQTTDKGYIIGGTSASGISGDKTQPTQGDWDFWIVKIDSLGNYQWDKDFGGTNEDFLFSMQQTKDGGYMLGGWSKSGIGGDKSQENWDLTYNTTDFWILKTDSLGIKQWDMRYGGTGWDCLYGLQQTKDGGYILGGSSYSPVSGDKTEPCWGGINADFWMVKIDSIGNKQWDKRFGGTGFDELYSLQQVTDGGYILGGLTNSSVSGDKTEPTWGIYPDEDYWIVKIDSLGNKEWDKDFGGTEWEDMFGDVIQTADEGYLICGSSYSDSSGNKTEDNPGLDRQTWLVKIDSLGNKLWDKTIFATGNEDAGFAIQTRDGCYVIADKSNSGIGGYKSQANWNNSFDYWLVKFCQAQLYFSSSEYTLCEKFCTNFYDQSINNPTSWQWQFPGGDPSSSTDQNPATICYNIPGNYDVTLITTNANGNDTLTLANYITVYATPPFPTITQSGYTLTSSPASSYQWQNNSIDIPGATNQSYIIPQSGYYTVIVSDSNGCQNSSSIKVFLSGIDNIESDANIYIYPNPSSGKFTIGLMNEMSAGEVSIEISNTLGQKVFSSSEKVSNSVWKKEIDLCNGATSGICTGVYFIEIKTQNVPSPGFIGVRKKIIIMK